MDFRFDAHIVKFNKDRTHPMLTDGWSQLRDVFDLHHNEELTFGYYGQDIFGILASKKFETEDQIPIFHSRCITPGKCVRFQVQLSHDSINKPYLVSIPFY
jgi:hypothetical protein